MFVTCVVGEELEKHLDRDNSTEWTSTINTASHETNGIERDTARKEQKCKRRF